MAQDGDPTRRLNQLREAAAHARLPFERDWWLNLAFYLGEQYVQWNPQLNTIERIPRKKEMKDYPRPVINKINHFVSQQHAFALSNEPVPDPLPATDSIIDLSLANVALAYVQYTTDPEMANFARQQWQAYLWALVAGEAYYKWCWDPKMKRPHVAFCSPFDVYVDPYPDDFGKARYVIHSKFLAPDQVEDMYGVEIKAPAEQVDPMRARLMREMGSAPVLEGVTVNELWQQPSAKFPNGLYAVWTGSQILLKPDRLPYEVCRRDHCLPFTQIGVVPRPGSLHFDSHVKYLRPAQIELNKYHAQRIAIREGFASPKWLVPEEIQLQTQPTNAPNQILRYNGGDSGLKPEVAQPAAMADNNEGQWITEEMMNVVGLHEVSQGQAPGRVESSKALELLKESDATRLSVLTKTSDESTSKGFGIILELARQYETVPRMVVAYSPEGIAEVKRFKAEDIPPGTRIRVRTNSGLAYTRAGRTDQLMRMWEIGLFQDNPDRFLQLLDVGASLGLSTNTQDIRLARNENMDLSKAQAVTPNSWDNHETHLREHNTYRKTHEYALLPEHAKERFEAHCSMHEEMQADALEKVAQLQAIAQGATLGGGAGGPQGEQQPAGPAQGPDPLSDTTAGQTGPGQAPQATPGPSGGPPPPPGGGGAGEADTSEG